MSPWKGLWLADTSEIKKKIFYHSSSYPIRHHKITNQNKFKKKLEKCYTLLQIRQKEQSLLFMSETYMPVQKHL